MVFAEKSPKKGHKTRGLENSKQQKAQLCGLGFL